MADYPVPLKIDRFFDKFYTLSYNLSASDPESLTLKELLVMADEEMKTMCDNMKFGYTDTTGHPLLIQEVAKLHQVKPEDVLQIIPIEGIYIAMHCLNTYLKSKYNLEKLHVITTYPAYQCLQENMRTLGCDISNWEMKHVQHTKHGKKQWEFKVDDLKPLIKDNTKLLVVNFPHNPTGALVNEKEWNEIIELCKEKDIFFFSDEMYRLVNLDDTAPLPSACSLYNNSISLSGLSKTFALPGLRLGWLCTQNTEILGMMKRFKDYTSACSPVPCEVLGIIALRNKDRIIKRTIDICLANLKIMESFVTDHHDVLVWKSPKSCTTGFLQIKGWLLKLGKGGASGFCDELVKETGIVLLPGTIYEFQPDEFVRLGFGRMIFPEAILKLKEFIVTHTPPTN